MTPSLRRIAPAAMPTILTEPPSLPTLRPETRRLCGAAEVAVFSETGEFTGLRQDYHSLQAPATPEEAAVSAAIVVWIVAQSVILAWPHKPRCRSARRDHLPCRYRR